MSNASETSMHVFFRRLTDLDDVQMKRAHRMSRAGVHEFGALQARVWDTMVDKCVHICVYIYMYIYIYAHLEHPGTIEEGYIIPNFGYNRR